MIELRFQKSHDKFNNDSIEYENESFKILTRGVFLGINTSGKNFLANHIIHEYGSKGEVFVKDFRGSFLIYLFDKSQNKHLVYTNHLGDKRIFYTMIGSRLLVSSSITDITEILNAEKQSCSLNRTAVYFLLTYGHMFGDNTLIHEVRRLNAGNYIRYSTGKVEIIKYYRLTNSADDSLDENESIEKLDECFIKSTQLEFEKDLQYGYEHLCSLSGGLDSRMTTWVANDLGYKNITAFTFSQTGQPDMNIPRQITSDLNIEWIFHPLDTGSFIGEFESVTRMVDATTSYLSISHGNAALKSVDFSKFGMLHTGQLGDVTVGSYLTKNKYDKPRFIKARSEKLIHKLPESTLEGYDNLELFLYLNRGLLYILTGNIPIQQYTEAGSPFLNIDFLNLCMSIPLKYRINHKLYKRWILRKYPGAAEYIWERLGSRINVPTVSIRKKSITYSRLPEFVYNGIRLKLGLVKKHELEGSSGMNPFEHWYRSNIEISHRIERYFRKNIDRVADPEIRHDCEMLFNTGSIHEKAQVITLLSGIKLFFS